ncbi:MAG TPA: undecaprenyl-diphosphatase UppP [Vicinamibacterales bacterium]
MSVLIAALLGAVQGITEFLPISSSAHLLLGRALFGWGEEPFGLVFDVATHLGTLAAVGLYFRQDLAGMARAVPELFSPTAHARLIRLIVVGTLPVVVVGLLFADAIEAHLRRPIVTVFTLALGGIGLLIAERLGSRQRDVDSLTWIDALAFGTAQAVALIPGISRSGSTLTLGMLIGVKREAAARFSFLLGIPAVLAAAAKEALELRHMAITPDLVVIFAVGIVSSAIVGYLAVRFLLRYLVTNRLDPFAYYRIALAAVVWWWVA